MVGIERVFPHFAKELAVLVDAMTSFGLDHDREAVVAVLVGEIRPMRRQDVGVSVDFQHAWILAEEPLGVRRAGWRGQAEAIDAGRGLPDLCSPRRLTPNFQLLTPDS